MVSGNKLQLFAKGKTINYSLSGEDFIFLFNVLTRLFFSIIGCSVIKAKKIEVVSWEDCFAYMLRLYCIICKQYPQVERQNIKTTLFIKIHAFIN